MKRTRVALLLATLGLVVAACSSGTAGAGNESPSQAAGTQSQQAGTESTGAASSGKEGAEKTELTVVEPYAAPRIGSSGDILYAVAKQEGYFDAAGVDVKIAYADGSSAALQAMAAGSGDIAAASLSAAMQAADKNLPLKVLSGVVINYPWKMAVQPDSDIKKPADLKGKTVGIISQASESYTFMLSYLKQAGISFDDVKSIPVGTGGAAVEALKRGEVDVLALYDSVYQQLESKGATFRYLDNPSNFANVVSIATVTSQKALSSKKAAIQAYMKAYNQAVVFGTVNPEAAVLDSFKEFPDLLAGETAKSALQAGVDSFVAYMKTATPLMGSTEWPTDPATWPTDWRTITAKQWAATSDYVIDGGLMKTPVAQAALYDDSLNANATDFDVHKVIDAAKAAPREAS